MFESLNLHLVTQPSVLSRNDKVLFVLISEEAFLIVTLVSYHSRRPTMSGLQTGMLGDGHPG